VIEIECDFTDPPHVHEYPDCWIFGGANELDPRADPRWKPTTYIYYDRDTSEITTTQWPLCDDEALDNFTQVARIRGADPRWISAKRPSSSPEMLPFLYDKATDTVYPA
jgi:hypothetical protein